MNSRLRSLCKSGQLAVLSFSEGLPTRLAYIPTHVVPHESAYPGWVCGGWVGWGEWGWVE